jgi:5-methylcytosine-specific restriction endonuclease McrA
MAERVKYNDGTWTTAKFNSFVTSILRSGSRRWGPKYTTLASAKTEKKINKATGRVAQHFLCNSCAEDFPAAHVQVDHIIPMGKGRSWDDFINELFCEADNLQVLCKPCHKIKTKEENKSK